MGLQNTWMEMVWGTITTTYLFSTRWDVKAWEIQCLSKRGLGMNVSDVLEFRIKEALERKGIEDMTGVILSPTKDSVEIYHNSILIAIVRSGE